MSDHKRVGGDGGGACREADVVACSGAAVCTGVVYYRGWVLCPVSSWQSAAEGRCVPLSWTAVPIGSRLKDAAWLPPAPSPIVRQIGPGECTCGDASPGEPDPSCNHGWGSLLPCGDGLNVSLAPGVAWACFGGSGSPASPAGYAASRSPELRRDHLRRHLLAAGAAAGEEQQSARAVSPPLFARRWMCSIVDRFVPGRARRDTPARDEVDQTVGEAGNGR